MIVYLGVNKEELHYMNTDLTGNKVFEYGVEAGMVYPDYMINQVKP